MDFNFTDEQEMIKKMLRRFCLDEIEPLAEKIDKENTIPESLLKKVHSLQILGVGYSSKYGGIEGDTITKMIVGEEISRSCPALAAMLSVDESAANAINEEGTEDQKRKYLPKLLSGEHWGSFAFTEADTGSDPKAIRTFAVEKEDSFEINGTKIFISNAVYPGPMVTFVKDKAREDKVTSFIIPKDAKGITIGAPIEKMGMNGLKAAEVVMENVRVPRENILGGEGLRGQGFKQLLKLIAHSRLAVGAESLGIAEEALSQAIQYSKQRMVNGRPMSKLPTIQTLIAEMATSVEAARWLVYRTAFLVDQGSEIIAESAIAKLLAARTAVEVTGKAMQVHGAYGYAKEFKIEKLYRDAKIGEIYRGSAELNKIVLANQILR